MPASLRHKNSGTPSGDIALWRLNAWAVVRIHAARSTVAHSDKLTCLANMFKHKARIGIGAAVSSAHRSVFIRVALHS